MSTIEYIEAREILDSRGNPTVEVEVLLATVQWDAPRYRQERRRANTRL